MASRVKNIDKITKEVGTFSSYLHLSVHTSLCADLVLTPLASGMKIIFVILSYFLPGSCLSYFHSCLCSCNSTAVGSDIPLGRHERAFHVCGTSRPTHSITSPSDHCNSITSSSCTLCGLATDLYVTLLLLLLLLPFLPDARHILLLCLFILSTG